MATQPIEMAIKTYRPAVSTTAQMSNYALVRLGGPQQADVGPAQAEMMLVLDRSGSMDSRGPGGQKHIERVIDAAEAVVGALRPQDRLGIIAFDDSARVVSPLTAGEKRNKLL